MSDMSVVYTSRWELVSEKPQREHQAEQLRHPAPSLVSSSHCQSFIEKSLETMSLGSSVCLLPSVQSMTLIGDHLALG